MVERAIQRKLHKKDLVDVPPDAADTTTPTPGPETLVSSEPQSPKRVLPSLEDFRNANPQEAVVAAELARKIERDLAEQGKGKLLGWDPEVETGRMVI